MATKLLKIISFAVVAYTVTACGNASSTDGAALSSTDETAEAEPSLGDNSYLATRDRYFEHNHSYMFKEYSQRRDEAIHSKAAMTLTRAVGTQITLRSIHPDQEVTGTLCAVREGKGATDNLEFGLEVSVARADATCEQAKGDQMVVVKERFLDRHDLTWFSVYDRASGDMIYSTQRFVVTPRHIRAVGEYRKLEAEKKAIAADDSELAESLKWREWNEFLSTGTDISEE